MIANYGVFMAGNGALDPQRTAVLTMEMQRGICGDLASFTALRDAVAGDVAGNTARLLHHARTVGAAVVHCTFSLRADRSGTRLDLPLMSAARKNPDYLLQGTTPTELLPELHQHHADTVIDRHHGVSPFTGTALHEILSRRGIEVVLVCGVSLNVGIPGLAIEAVNLGYSVEIVRDAVAGFPADYAAAVLNNTLSAIARIDTTESVMSRFSPVA